MTIEQIKDIAENLDCGFRCFIHTDTKGGKFIPDLDKHPDMDSDAWDADNEEIENNFGDYIEIKAMDSRDFFSVMADFTDTVDNEEIKKQLGQSLDRPKPFQNFKFTVDNSGVYRERWFKFKGERLIDWVDHQLKESEL